MGTVIRTYKYRLLPNKSQEMVLSSWLIMCCRLYNAALEQRIYAYKQSKRSVTRYEQHADLSELRNDQEWWAISANVLRSALDRLDLAFSAFYRRCRSGDAPGFPRFKHSGTYESFSIYRPKVSENYVRVPKLGMVKLNLYRPLPVDLGDRLRDTKINRDSSGRWWVLFQCMVDDVIPKNPMTMTGVDLGINSFISLSDGRSVSNPRFYRNGQQLLARRQQELAAKRKGSRAQKKAKRLVARAHQHIKDQRLDHARKLACELLSEYDSVAHEKLNIQGMINGLNLSKSINDAGWAIFIRCLTLKAENAGKWVFPVDPRGTSQRCSSCDLVVIKSLSERRHRCPNTDCLLDIDRDHNAAINVLRLGQSQASSKFNYRVTGIPKRDMTVDGEHFSGTAIGFVTCNITY